MTPQSPDVTIEVIHTQGQQRVDIKQHSPLTIATATDCIVSAIKALMLKAREIERANPSLHPFVDIQEWIRTGMKATKPS